MFGGRVKTTEPIEMPFGVWTRVGPRKHVLGGVHTGVTWRIPLNCPCVAATRPFYGRPIYVIGHAIIFLACGFFFFLIYLFIYLFISFFLSFYLFSSPNLTLSRPRLDVYHTSTHDVALVRIWDAGLKRAARVSLEIQDAKNRQKSPSRHHRTTLSGYISSQLRHISTIGKKLVKQQYLLQTSSQYGELRPTNG